MLDQNASRLEHGRSVLMVPRVGRNVATGDVALPWRVLDGSRLPIVPVSKFMRELVACGNTAASCRSYAYDLLRWFRSWQWKKQADRLQQQAKLGEHGTSPLR
ncbi:hypothetical protein ACFC5Z_42975 [Streptomyces sp. NPDC056004]|uniref:hypothetical protein n=1 Tax=Streptomyces sp. NPDC056004 TaxID=3345677 RepID=UPI0035E36966